MEEKWREIAAFSSEEEYNAFRYYQLRNAPVFVKKNVTCRLCIGHHPMEERRMKCSSKTCKKFTSVQCPAMWKMHRCTATNAIRVYDNMQV
jgi:hypothetical protein